MNLREGIAGIGQAVVCEVVGCSHLSANCCCECDKAICQEHSHPTISDEGHDAFACPYCFYHEDEPLSDNPLDEDWVQPDDA